MGDKLTEAAGQISSCLLFDSGARVASSRHIWVPCDASDVAAFTYRVREMRHGRARREVEYTGYGCRSVHVIEYETLCELRRTTLVEAIHGCYRMRRAAACEGVAQRMAAALIEQLIGELAPAVVSEASVAEVQREASRREEARKAAEREAAAERRAMRERAVAFEAAIAAASARVAAKAVGAVLGRYPRRDRPDCQRSAEAKRRRRARSKSSRLQREPAEGDAEGAGAAAAGPSS